MVRNSQSADRSLRPKPDSRLFFCSWFSVVDEDEAAPPEIGLVGVLGCTCTEGADLRIHPESTGLLCKVWPLQFKFNMR